MKLHKYATLTPDYSPEEFIRLKNSIKDKGEVQVPIVVTHDGKLLCGRHRYEAVKQLKSLKVSDIPVTKLPKMSDEELREYAIRNEAERRHMTAGQRRSYLIKMYDDKLVFDSAGKPKEGKPADGAVTITDLADRFGENQSHLSKTLRVEREADPKIWEAVVDGIVADTDAYNILDEDHIYQRDYLEEVVNKKASSLSKARDMLANTPERKKDRPAPTREPLGDLPLPEGCYGVLVVDFKNYYGDHNDLGQEPISNLFDRDCWIIVRTDSKNLPDVYDMVVDWNHIETPLYRFTMTSEYVTKAGREAGKKGKDGEPSENLDFFVVFSIGNPKIDNIEELKLASRQNIVPLDFYVRLDKVVSPDVDKLIMFSDEIELSGWETWQLNEQIQEG